MKKDTLNTFIDKYSLNGTIESVKWTVSSDDKTIKTSAISDDKNVLGFVTIKDNADLNDTEIGVNDTLKLKKMLTVLGEDVSISPNETNNKVTSLVLKSESTDIQYVTADLSVIPKSPELKKLPDFNLEIPLTKEFITTFVKAKNALSDVDIFTLTSSKSGKKSKIKMTLGFSNVNSNRINIDIDPAKSKSTLGKTIHFSAKYLKEILTSNNDCENAVLKVSDAGLANVEFDNDNFHSNYFLLEIKNID